MNDDFVLPNDDSVVPSSMGGASVTDDPVVQASDPVASNTANDQAGQKPKKDPLELLEELLNDAKNSPGGNDGASVDPVAQAKKEAEEKAKILEEEKAALMRELEQKKQELDQKDLIEIEEKKKALEDLKLHSPQGIAKQQQADEKQHQIDEKQQANDGFEIEQLGHTKIVE